MLSKSKKKRMPVDILRKLTAVIHNPGDISEHLVFLSNLASECESILECGVRSIVSSWAFVNGLTINKSANKLLHCCDTQLSPGAQELATACKEQKIEHTFYAMNDLHLPMQEYDMVFIDTWHIYGHLKRELAKMAPYAKKYIVMHDTEIDKVRGESLRIHDDIAAKIRESGYTYEEVTTGLGKAIDEFLIANDEWRIKYHFKNCNGLTVLERI
jgi:hypothetical protein